MHHCKKTVLTITTIVCAVCLLTALPAVAMQHKGDVVFVKTADNFIILYDSSSSMADPYGNTSMKEIEAEKQILTEKISTLPELDWQAGIYTFTPGVMSMGNLKPYLEMRTYNKAEFAETVSALPVKPSGSTRLKGGLVGLESVLEKLQGKTVVFVFTDGQYSSQPGFPSPGSTAKRLAETYDVCFQVISTDKDKAQYKAVMNIAAASSCSGTIKFGKLLGHPEWMTDILFRVEYKAKSAVAAPPEKVVGWTRGDVLFAFDKSNIDEKAAKELIELTIFLNENKGKRVVLAGHTDNLGSEEYNLKLSQRRAESARTYLVEKMGIDASRITLSWFGKSDPAVGNDTEEGRSKNRRVTIVITD